MSLCRSCGAQIAWFKSVLTDKAMPVDVEPVADGNVVIRNGKAHVLRANTPVQDDELRYVNHFATCPNAAEHRK